VLYAKVVLGLPIEGPFDYHVPKEWEDKILPGARVWVNFRNKKEVAYVTGLSSRTAIKKVKDILEIIDPQPLIDKKMFLLADKIAQYYCCSLGEALESMLPEELRKGRKWGQSEFSLPKAGKFALTPFSQRLHFIQGAERISAYLREIKATLLQKRSVILLFSDIALAKKTAEIIERDSEAKVFVLFSKQVKGFSVWQNIKKEEYCVVVGVRSNVFAPVNSLGLIIIDQENDQVYKQEQVPHYHAREVALMRAEIEEAKVVLGANLLSLESFYLAQNNKIEYEIIPAERKYPEIRLIDPSRVAYADRKNKPIFSKYLADAIYANLLEKGRILLFINRKGFATSAACHNCGAALKCPRCNINLVFHFDENKLKCHHCNFKMLLPEICPVCNAGYIKYSGLGTEKIESELARVFPQARIKLMDDFKGDLNLIDILVSTSAVIKHKELNFDLIGVLGIDNSLNRVDFRSAEKTFGLLLGLSALTTKKIIIESSNSNHHCFRALINNDPSFFLKEELKERKQLKFPPFKHMVLVKIRGRNLDKVKKASYDLFEKLNKIKTSSLKLISLNPAQPPKLRGNFYYQILIRASNPKAASGFLKLHLKSERYSGIIITVDVDPV